MGVSTPASRRPRGAIGRGVRLAAVAAATVATLAGAALSGPSASAHLSFQQATAAKPKPHVVKVDPRFFGVHDAHLTSLSRRGTGSIRLWDSGTTWAQIQPAGPTSWDFSRLDQVVADAWANHTEVTLVVGATPLWAVTPGSTTPGPTSAPQVAAYATFLRTLMQRYADYQGSGRPGIADYQVWNEANIVTFWTGTMSQMVQLVKTAYDVRNATDPKVRLVAPAMVTRLRYQQKWIKSFYQQTVGNRPVWRYVDALSVNLYPLDTYPTSSGGTRPGTPEDAMLLLGQVRGLLASDKVPATLPIWDTEINYGMHTGDLGGHSATPISDDRQVAYVLRTYLLNAAQGVRRVEWYAYDMGNLPLAMGGTPLGNTLLTDPDPAVRAEGVLTPAGLAFTRVQSWLKGGTLVGTASQRPCIRDRRGTYTCTIEYASSVARVYWNPYHHAKVRVARSARKKVDEYGVAHRVRGGSRLRVDYRPVLVRSTT